MARFPYSSWLLLAAAFAAGAARAGAQVEPPPVLSQALPSQTLTASGPVANLNLAQFFSNPSVPGTAVRISVNAGVLGSGNIDLALTDQQTPQTVANFLAYIGTGSYSNNIIHRTLPGFIIQGGGFFFPTNSSTLSAVGTMPPVPNEPVFSNTPGTIAMAKLGGDPNSATSQWFINVANNSANLDNQNGGFTVFGITLGNGLAVAQAVDQITTHDESGTLNNLALNEVPLSLNDPTKPANFIQTSIAVIPGMTFTASAADGTLVSVTLSGNSLQLTPAVANSGNTTVTVTASALDGGSLTASFAVAIAPVPVAPTFTASPAAVGVLAGQTATFAAAATGVPTPALQWQSAPPGLGVFSNLANGANFSGVTTATLSVLNPTVAMSGTQLRCVASNSAASGVVSGTATLTVTPAPATVTLSGLTPIFTGSSLPVTATTNPSGLGVTVLYNGSATPPTAAGSYTVTATVNDPNHTGSTSGTLVIARAPATVTLSALTPPFTGTALPVTVATNPAGLAVAVTYGGSSTVPTNAGSYAVVATVTDPNHTGSTSGTLVISQALATVTLSGLAQAFSGAALPVTVATNPTGLGVTVLYSGSATPPTAVGSYPVLATVSDPNHTGSVSATLVISPDFASYLAQHFTAQQLANPAVTGPTANPAGDGMSNVMKYALGLDPTVPNAAAGAPVVGASGGALTLTYVAPPGITDVTYIVEVSGDLVTWTSSSGATQVLSTTLLDATHQQVVVRDLTPMTGTARRFIRLRVTQ